LFNIVDKIVNYYYNTFNHIELNAQNSDLAGLHSMANLGFVGLGLMGSRIVKRLLDAGHQVAGYNRTPAKAEKLIQVGMRWCNTPREVAQAADITFSMVSDTVALSSIAEGSDGVLAGLSAGKIYVDMSTVSPRLIRDLARRVAAVGAHMLEAPVSGGPSAVEAGTLAIFVGGETETLETVRPIFEVLGQKIIHVGDNGQAVSMKIAINLSLATQLLSLFEGVLLAERSGIPRAAALDALLNSVIASPVLKYRAPFILKMPDEVWFNVMMMQKDMQLALEMGRELGVPLFTVGLANEMLSAAKAMGYGEQDFAVLFKVLARVSGMSEA
jgi:3-hydroxyisobutyrate dehydrogenase-like beta-hydroxyacid dehydrogenase